MPDTTQPMTDAERIDLLERRLHNTEFALLALLDLCNRTNMQPHSAPLTEGYFASQRALGACPEDRPGFVGPPVNKILLGIRSSGTGKGN